MSHFLMVRNAHTVSDQALDVALHHPHVKAVSAFDVLFLYSFMEN